MPQYEYFCHSCQKPFSKTLTLQYEEGEIACPDCGSKEVEQAVTTFFASAPKKSCIAAARGFTPSLSRDPPRSSCPRRRQ